MTYAEAGLCLCLCVIECFVCSVFCSHQKLVSLKFHKVFTLNLCSEVCVCFVNVC